jgi:IS5 family transposase
LKAHLSVDPDSELIDDVIVTPANTHDAEPAADLLADYVDDEDKPMVFGDSAYAGADILDDLGEAGFDVRAKVPPARGRDGRFGKDDFDVDLETGSVSCPAGHVVPIRFGPDGEGKADFGAHCEGCPLRERCTTSASGRSVTIHRKEALLQRHKAAQSDPEWQQSYRSTRPKVERKIANFVRVAWGGRKARTRGRERVTTDAHTRAAAVNFARLATLGVHRVDGRWATAGC